MFTKEISYKDFNDVEHTEKVHFHMMAPEMADLEFNPVFESGPSGKGGLGDYIRSAMESGDGRKVYTFFKMMIVNSYGRRSEDGSKFTKRPEFTEEFLNSKAYEEFFMWLVSDPKNAETFWLGIMPERLADIADQLENDTEGKKKKHIKDMSREELLELMQQKVADKAPAAVTA